MIRRISLLAGKKSNIEDIEIKNSSHLNLPK